MRQKPIYLDYNATAPMRDEVREAVIETMDMTGNPSSIHAFGRKTRSAIEKARETIAAFVNARATNIIFAGSATEANNTILNGMPNIETVFISAGEHPSVDKARDNVVQIPLLQTGLIDLEFFKQACERAQSKNAPFLVSIHAVNSETGVIQPVREIAEITHQNGGIFHCDAVQAAGRIPIDYMDWGCDFITISGHKMAGPIGAAAIIAADLKPFAPYLKGGGQEKRRRAGTENISAIIGMAKAAELAGRDLDNYQKRLSALQTKLESGLLSIHPRAIIVGRDAPRVANTTNIITPGIEAEKQLMFFDLEGIAVSSGSACSSGSVNVSHVLKAMAYNDDLAKCSIRVSTGWNSTEADINAFLDVYKKMTTLNQK